MLSSVGQLFESDGWLDDDVYGSDYFIWQHVQGFVWSWIKRDVLKWLGLSELSLIQAETI